MTNCCENLCFILGRERSGTSLLATILNGHTKISIPPESPFIKLLYAKYKNKQFSSESDYRSVVKDLKLEPYLRVRKVDYELVLDTLLRDRPKTYPEVCYSIIRSLLSKQQLIVGDKNPQYTYWRPLTNLFPDSKVIAIVRDPRSQVHSMLNVNFERHDVASLCQRWNVFSQSILDIKRRLGAQALIIKYEELVSVPQKTIETVCEFLNVDYDKNMISHRLCSVVSERFYQSTDHINLNRPLDQALLYSWKEGLSVKQVKIIEHITAELAQKLGYEIVRQDRAYALSVVIFPSRLYGYGLFIYDGLMQRIPLRIRMFVFYRFIVPLFRFWRSRTST